MLDKDERTRVLTSETQKAKLHTRPTRVTHRSHLAGSIEVPRDWACSLSLTRCSRWHRQLRTHLSPNTSFPRDIVAYSPNAGFTAPSPALSIDVTRGPAVPEVFNDARTQKSRALFPSVLPLLHLQPLISACNNSTKLKM